LQVSRDDDRAFIRKSYRKLAREHHPDRQQTPSAKAEAELHLRKLNIAYEILMDEEQRRDYDYMLDNPEETYFHYYRYYRHRYSPKIDVRIVIAIIVTVLCVIQCQRSAVASLRCIALMPLERRPGAGILPGCPSLDRRSRDAEVGFEPQTFRSHRAKAREIASADGLLSVRRKDNGARFTREELKDREEAILRDIISRTVDLRGDCAKPSLRRLFICQLVLLPYTCYCWLIWAFKWVWFYWILRHPYDEAAKVFLTRRRLGMSEAQWDGLDEERRDAFMKKQLWDPIAFQLRPSSRYGLRDNYPRVCGAEDWTKWLECEFTDRKVRGSNPTSASRLPQSRLGRPGSIPALVLPSGGMAARHRKDAMVERFFLT
ncbi:hypothetical protein T265_12856, partial [Opisthorchis viverrini]